jgi:tetratricopeptide (TPR) repeat protein
MYCGVEVIVRTAVQAASVGRVTNLMKLAISAAQVRNFPEAYSYFIKVLEFNADYPDAWLGRAEISAWLCTSRQSRFPEVLGAVRRALELASPARRLEIERRAGAALANAGSQYMHHLYIDGSRFFNKGELWNTYLRECTRTIADLEEAHRLLPNEISILHALTDICARHSGEIVYQCLGPNNRWRQARRQPPTDYAHACNTKAEHYSAILNALDPNAPKVQPLERRSWVKKILS